VAVIYYLRKKCHFVVDVFDAERCSWWRLNDGIVEHVGAVGAIGAIGARTAARERADSRPELPGRCPLVPLGTVPWHRSGVDNQLDHTIAGLIHPLYTDARGDWEAARRYPQVRGSKLSTMRVCGIVYKRVSAARTRAWMEMDDGRCLPPPPPSPWEGAIHSTMRSMPAPFLFAGVVPRTPAFEAAKKAGAEWVSERLAGAPPLARAAEALSELARLPSSHGTDVEAAAKLRRMDSF
jgi:hypothetical protein